MWAHSPLGPGTPRGASPHQLHQPPDWFPPSTPLWGEIRPKQPKHSRSHRSVSPWSPRDASTFTQRRSQQPHMSQMNTGTLCECE